jgi:hypothetical protein
MAAAKVARRVGKSLPYQSDGSRLINPLCGSQCNSLRPERTRPTDRALEMCLAALFRRIPPNLSLSAGKMFIHI